MRTLLTVAFCVGLVTTAVAQTVVAPPDANDHSCQARAVRMFPWASQALWRSMWLERCMQHQDELDFRDRAMFDRGPNNVGTGTTCINSRYGDIITTFCK